MKMYKYEKHKVFRDSKYWFKYTMSIHLVRVIINEM